jgi:hypothetical protein
MKAMEIYQGDREFKSLYTGIFFEKNNDEGECAAFLL